MDFRLFFIHLDTLINKRSLLPKAAINFQQGTGNAENISRFCIFPISSLKLW